MGWKGFEISIPAGMLFRKMFCHKCGAELKKEKITKCYKRGEQGFSIWVPGAGLTLGMSELSRSHYIYKCPNCNALIDYKDQRIVAKKQKLLNKKILNESDLKS